MRALLLFFAFFSPRIFSPQLTTTTSKQPPPHTHTHTPVASWPGLLDVFLKHLKKGGDVPPKSARGPGGDVNGAKLLRRLVGVADDEARCGESLGREREMGGFEIA